MPPRPPDAPRKTRHSGKWACKTSSSYTGRRYKSFCPISRLLASCVLFSNVIMITVRRSILLCSIDKFSGIVIFLIEVLNLIGIFKVFVILAMLLQMKYTRNHCYCKELYFIYTFFRYISWCDKKYWIYRSILHLKSCSWLYYNE